MDEKQSLRLVAFHGRVVPSENSPTDALLWAQRRRVTERLSGVSAVRGIVLRGAVTVR